MLEAENIRVVKSGKPILDGVSLRFPAGRYHALIGPNGSGKSTLMGVLLGLTRPDRGSIRLMDKPLSAYSVPERARLMAYVQQKEQSNLPFTCMEVALMGLNPRRSRGQSVTRAELDEAERRMDETDTLRFSARQAGTLSGGEFQRLLIARALLQSPRILFLDEAMSEMDVRVRIQMQALLRREVRETGLTVIAVHHDLSAAYVESDETAALKAGRLAGQGQTEALMTPELIQSVFGVRAEILKGKGILVLDAENNKQRRTIP